MSDPLVIRGSAEAAARLRAMTQGLGDAAMDGAKAGCEHIRGFMVANYLSGQRLRRRSGKLADGWSIRAFQGANDEVDATLATSTRYAPTQEYGSRATVNVKEYDRRLLKVTATREQRKRNPRAVNRIDKVGRVHRRWRTGQNGVELSVRVQAHTRQNNIPPHRFLRDAVRTQSAAALGIVAQVIRRRLSGGGGAPNA